LEEALESADDVDVLDEPDLPFEVEGSVKRETSNTDAPSGNDGIWAVYEQDGVYI
jgi:hypothetical protein